MRRTTIACGIFGLALAACAREPIEALGADSGASIGVDAAARDATAPHVNADAATVAALDATAPDASSPADAEPSDAEVMDAASVPCVPHTPVAPSASEFMWQGGQKSFLDAQGQRCAGRVSIAI